MVTSERAVPRKEASLKRLQLYYSSHVTFWKESDGRRAGRGGVLAMGNACSVSCGCCQLCDGALSKLTGLR